MLSETQSTPEPRETGSTRVTTARGMLVVVSSPSGGGKGTLIRRVLNSVPNLGYSVSFTTRARVKAKIDGLPIQSSQLTNFKR